MAALSSTTFCSDWGSLHQLPNCNHDYPNPDFDEFLSFQTQQDQLAAAAFLGLDYSNVAFEHDLTQTFFNDQEFLLPLDDHEYYYHDECFPKRQKTHHQFYPNSNRFVPNPSHLVPELVQPQLILPSPQVQIQQQPPHLYANCGLISNDVSAAAKMKAENGGGGSLSPQSIAARERRRKITVKTSELGKLVPSGNKMNTAEMLQAAYKYVKFLQAQVAMLKLMDSIQENKGEELHIEEGLQILVSPIVHEKLYSEEKCLVSKKFVEALANSHDIQSQPLLKDNVAKLLR